MGVINTKRRSKCGTCGWYVVAYDMKKHRAKYHPAKKQTPRDPAARALAKKCLEDEWFCAYCGNLGTETRGPDGLRWALDHVKPLKLGGKEHMENYVKSCQSCNSRKGAKFIVPIGRTRTASGKQLQDTELWQNLKGGQMMKEYWEPIYIL